MGRAIVHAARLPASAQSRRARQQLLSPQRRNMRGGASSTKSAVDRMEASFFRSFAAVNGALRAPPPTVEDH
jgi:hypothetical protein